MPTATAAPPTPRRYDVRDPEPPATPKVIGGGEILSVFLIVAVIALAMAFPFKSMKLITVILLANVAIMQTLRRPAAGLALLALGVSWIDLIPPETFGVKGVNAETVVFFFALFVWARSNQLEDREALNSPLSKILLVYTLMILLSCLNSWVNWQMGLFDLVTAWKNHVMYFIFLPVAFHVCRKREDQLLVIFACSVALAIAFAEGINHSLPGLLAGHLDRRRAVARIAIQPNAFGAAISMYWPVLITLALHRAVGTAARWWFGILSLAAGVALFMTLSRGSWVGAVGGLVVVALIRDRRLLVLLLLASATYSLWVPQQAIDRVEQTGNIDAGNDYSGDQVVDDSTQMRIEQYKSLPAMMAPRPIHGWGYQSFSVIFEKYGTLGRAKGPHSSYCQIGTEEGLIGLAVFLVVLGMMVWTCWRAARIPPDPLFRWIGVGLVGGTFAMVICMTSGARWQPQKMFTLYWMLVGIIERETILEVLRQRRADPLSISRDRR